ncbi:MAG: hypothetical protein LBG84_09100 [Treponema sp.]|jgi:hypothetical protein|nr:hypothetical protein [Treponema sp.]
MVWSSARRGLHYAAAAYLALAVMGTLTLLSVGAPGFTNPAGKTTQGAFAASPVQPVECLAAGAAKDHSFSPLRQCPPREAPAVACFTAGAGLSCGAVRFTAGTAARTKKSAILLKRRI